MQSGGYVQMIREICCFHLHSSVLPWRWRCSSSSRTLVEIHQTAWHNTLEDNLQRRQCDDKSHNAKASFNMTGYWTPSFGRNIAYEYCVLKYNSRNNIPNPQNINKYIEYRTPCTFTAGDRHLDWRTRFHLAGKIPSLHGVIIVKTVPFSLRWKPKMSHTSNLITYSKS
jgi:hypothetical protein